MNRRLVLIGTITILVGAVGVAWLGAAPSIGETAVTPTVVGINTPTQVTVTTRISDTTLIPASINLLKVDAGGNTVANVGRMFDDGTHGDAAAGDNLFSVNVALNETTTGRAFFQVSAAFRGTVKRVLSPLVHVSVWKNSDIPDIGTLLVPQGWSVRTEGGIARLTSPELEAERVTGEADVPLSDITLVTFRADTTTALEVVANGYEDGWFTAYRSHWTTNLHGLEAVSYSDIGATPAHVPLAAWFVRKDENVYMFRLGSDEHLTLAEFTELVRAAVPNLR